MSSTSCHAGSFSLYEKNLWPAGDYVQTQAPRRHWNRPGCLATWNWHSGTTQVFWNRNAGSKLMLAFRRDRPAVAAIVAFGIAACVASYCSRRVWESMAWWAADKIRSLRRSCRGRGRWTLQSTKHVYGSDDYTAAQFETKGGLRESQLHA